MTNEGASTIADDVAAASIAAATADPSPMERSAGLPLRGMRRLAVDVHMMLRVHQIP